MVNKQGQTRLASYFEWFPIQERVALEAEVRRLFVGRSKLSMWIIIVYRSSADAFPARSSSALSSSTAAIK